MNIILTQLIENKINKKSADDINKTISTFQKKINRLRNTCTSLMISNKNRKHQISQYNLFIKKLLSEKRITKEEISEYMNKK